MNEIATSETPLVEMQNVHRYFGRVRALRGVNFTVNAGEIVGLVGDNGAGKSTLIKVLTGVHTPTRGQIYFEGQPVNITSPQVARQIGIETVYQDFALVPLLSIARNFWLGREPTWHFGPFQFLDHNKMGELAREALADVGITIRDPSEEVGQMSGGERQSIAIGRAVYFGKKLLILDEPTSALSVGETRKVMEYTRAAKARGMGVIFITHNIAQIHELADRFAIISHGKKVGDFTKDDVSLEEVEHMVMTGEVPDRLLLDVAEELDEEDEVA
jgi:simple sugar transport system ATP-binding protein